MRAILAALVIIGLMFSVTGCNRGPVPAEPTSAENAEIGSADGQLLQDILQAQQQSGSSLEQLLKDIKQQNAVQAQAAGPSAFQRDLLCAQSLLVAVRRAVNAQDKTAAVLNLRRLEQAVSMMRADCPVAQIAASLERAIVALQGGAGYIEADIASVSVLNAQSAALKSADAALVPNIGLPKELETVKSHIDKGEYKDATKSINDLIQSLLSNDSLKTIANAYDGVKGAKATMDRDAGYVVIAELDQLSDIFRKLNSMVKAAPAAQPEETAKPSNTGGNSSGTVSPSKSSDNETQTGNAQGRAASANTGNTAQQPTAQPQTATPATGAEQTNTNNDKQ